MFTGEIVWKGNKEMKQLWAMIKKENIVLFRNVVLYVSTLVLPVFVLCVNYYISNKSTVKIYVGLISENKSFKEILENSSVEGIEFYILDYENYSLANLAFEDNKIDIFINETRTGEVKFYLDFNNTKGQIAYKYLTSTIQRTNSDEIMKNNRKFIEQLTEVQKYKIQEPIDLRSKGSITVGNALLLTGILWIFLYTPLSQATNQIVQEKSKKTLFLIFKAPVAGIKVFASKLSAILIQFTASCVLYFIALNKLKLLSIDFSISNILLFYLIIITISSIGYLIGMLFSNQGFVSMLSLVAIGPVMILNSIGNTDFDYILKILPTFYCSKLLVDIINNTSISNQYIYICIFTIIINTILSIVVLNKSDAVNLCKFID